MFLLLTACLLFMLLFLVFGEIKTNYNRGWTKKKYSILFYSNTSPMSKNPNILEMNNTVSSFEYRIQLKMKLCATLHFSPSLCCFLFDVRGRKSCAPVGSMRGWWWKRGDGAKWWEGGCRVVSRRQLPWVSIHLSLLLPAMLCQTLLFQINKC